MHLQRRPPVDDPAHTRHVAAPFAAQKHNHIRDLLLQRDPPHRHRLADRVPKPRAAVEGARHHRRGHPGGADGVDADGVRGQVER